MSTPPTSKWKTWHKIVLGLCGLLLIAGIFGEDEAEAKAAASKIPAQIAQEQKTKDSLARREKLEGNFSAWDGSHKALVKLVKKSLNDEGSFDHVETKFWDMSDENIVVLMTYRAKNGFGAKVLGSVKAKTNLSGDVVEVLETQ